MPPIQRGDQVIRRSLFPRDDPHIVFLKKGEDRVRRRSGFFGCSKRFLIGVQVQIRLIRLKPVHQHLDARGSAGVAAVLAQIRNVNQNVGILRSACVEALRGCVRLSFPGAGERTQTQRADQGGRRKDSIAFLHGAPPTLYNKSGDKNTPA